MEEYNMNPIIKQIQNAIDELQELLAAIEMLGDNTPALLYQLANEKSQAIADATSLLLSEKGDEEQPPAVEPQEAITVIEEETPPQTVEEVPFVVEPTPIVPSAIERKELRKSLTLNDRFLFRRELFNGSDAVMHEALDAIHQCATHALALEWIEQHYSWDAEAPAVIEFMALLEKNYNTK